MGSLRNRYLLVHSGTHGLKQVFVGTALFYELHTPIIAIFYLISLVMKRSFEFQSDKYAVRLGYGN